jgi:hypothetical protein
MRLMLFHDANATSIQQPMDQGVISTSKTYYLRNTRAATDSNPFDGSRQSKLKIF